MTELRIGAPETFWAITATVATTADETSIVLNLHPGTFEYPLPLISLNMTVPYGNDPGLSQVDYLRYTMIDALRLAREQWPR